ncbi:hypothetical protein F5146DRAFT_641377 [Armillaria mellea]|nr:hypothetical protein F5146DRAFT_641377 [Armillaria mellea]
MCLQRLEDKDEVEHPFATKLAVSSSLSSSSCASFSFVSPALLSLFFPAPFPFPVFACSCVPVFRCSSVCVAVVFLFRRFDPASVYRAFLPVAFIFMGPCAQCPIPWYPCVMSHSGVWSCLVPCLFLP